MSENRCCQRNLRFITSRRLSNVNLKNRRKSKIRNHLRLSIQRQTQRLTQSMNLRKVRLIPRKNEDDEMRRLWSKGSRISNDEMLRRDYDRD